MGFIRVSSPLFWGAAFLKVLNFFFIWQETLKSVGKQSLEPPAFLCGGIFKTKE